MVRRRYIIVNMTGLKYTTIISGIELVLYFRILRHVYNSRTRTFMDKFLTIFSTALVLLNTIYWTTQAYFGEMMWIIHVDYPGGADAYWNDYASVWYQTWGTTACVMCNLMNDALLVRPRRRCTSLTPIRRAPGIPMFRDLEQPQDHHPAAHPLVRVTRCAPSLTSIAPVP